MLRCLRGIFGGASSGGSPVLGLSCLPCGSAEPQVYAECAARSRFTFFLQRCRHFVLFHTQFSSLFCARFIYFMSRTALIQVVTFLNSQIDVLKLCNGSTCRTVNFHLFVTGDSCNLLHGRTKYKDFAPCLFAVASGEETPASTHLMFQQLMFDCFFDAVTRLIGCEMLLLGSFIFSFSVSSSHHQEICNR